MKLARCLVLLAMAASAAACNPYLNQRSVAPPGRAARLDPVEGFWGLKRYRLEISEGVALALTCNKGGPCEKLTVTSDDPAIAEVRLASLAALESPGYGHGVAASPQPAAAFVVIGKAPGLTRLHVRSKEGQRDVVVTVVPPPAQAVPAPAPPASTAL